MITENKKTVFSGIQPTSSVHLGNYFGAVSNWLNLQTQQYNNVYCIVDMHAITVFQNPSMLKQNTLNILALLLACGINPDKSLLFVQSTNPYHAELAWILNCVARVGWVNRMTQFKDKAGDNKEKSSLGLYSYPVLQAADILLYNASFVPVGQDQKQHIELARDIAIKFNKDYGEVFVIPEPVISSNAPKIKSLSDSNKKMSKSDTEASKINLTDAPSEISKKISKAQTDAGVMPTEVGELELRPEIANLITIYALCSKTTVAQVIENYQGAGYAKFKTNLAEVIINFVKPIQDNYNNLLKEPQYMLNLVDQSKEQSMALSAAHIKNIRQKVGFLL